MIQLVLLVFYCTKVEKFKSTKVQKYESTKSTKGTKGESGCRPELLYHQPGLAGVDPKICRRILEN